MDSSWEIYSLSPYTQRKIIAREFVLSDELDGILNIVDAANIERNLYLTCCNLVALGLLGRWPPLGFMMTARAGHRDRPARMSARLAGRPSFENGQKGREYA